MSEPSRSASRRLYPLCLVVLTFVVYVNGVTTPFVLDDRMVFESGSTIRSWENAWNSGPTRRLGMLTFAANYRVHGMRVVGYHLVNIAIHAAAALALYGLSRRTMALPDMPSWLAGRADMLAAIITALWVIHPLQTESVTYTVQRFESLAGLFCLASWYAFARGATTSPGWPWLAASVFAASLGVQTKETTFVIPFVALAYDRLFIATSWRELMRRRGLWHALLAVNSAWLLWKIAWAFDASRAASAGMGVQGLTAWMYLRSQAGVILHYLRLSVWPDTLCLDYSWPVARSFQAIYPPGAVILTLLGLTAYGLWRAPRVGFLGLAFFLLLAPTSSFMPIADLAFEHRMYLPLAPLVALVVLGVARAGDWIATRSPAARRMLAVGLTLVVVGYGARTVFRNREYRDPLRLWTQCVQVNPRNSRAHTWIGMYHFERGHDDLAIASYREALRINPRNWLVHLNLGAAHLRKEEDSQAILCFQRCMKLNPTYHLAYQNYGSLLLRQGKIDEAINAYRWAVHYGPTDPRMWNALGLAYEKKGELARAKASFLKAKKVDPTHPDADRLLARLAATAAAAKPGDSSSTTARNP